MTKPFTRELFIEELNKGRKKFQGVILKDLDLSDLDLSNIDFKNAELTNIDFRRSKFLFTNFAGTKLKNIDARDIKLMSTATISSETEINGLQLTKDNTESDVFILKCKSRYINLENITYHSNKVENTPIVRIKRFFKEQLGLNSF